ncbi:MAG: hypothetical protein ACOVRN_01070 [Flavobacterium sp.]
MKRVSRYLHDLSFNMPVVTRSLSKQSPVVETTPNDEDERIYKELYRENLIIELNKHLTNFGNLSTKKDKVEAITHLFRIVCKKLPKAIDIGGIEPWKRFGVALFSKIGEFIGELCAKNSFHDIPPEITKQCIQQLSAATRLCVSLLQSHQDVISTMTPDMALFFMYCEMLVNNDTK